MVCCSVQAPDGSPSDVWSQLPYEVLRAAEHRLDTLAAIQMKGIPIADAPGEQAALQPAIRAAKQALFLQQKQQRYEQQELRHQLGGMQARLVEQQARLDQQDKELLKLRGEMAAMAAQLQAVTQQQTQR